ncbi:hypothetical protein FRC11_009587 [Ceratobasidium sp. 423]|nr:hypothetical protein FRC11_009587 [Ceratobasidium sp. 423]
MSEPSNSPGQLLYVFPPRSDKKISSQISSQVPIGRGHYSFVPEQLYNEFTLKYDPDERIESVLVKSAWYGKQKKRARHEFILIVVEDTGIGLTNYIVLDRNNSGNPPIAGKGSSLGNVGYSQSCQGAALDAFRVSYNGEEKQLLQECQLLPCQYVEKIEFSDTEPLFLYQLVTLVYVISKTSYNYAVMGENCYWFAGLIWESLRNLRPGAQHIDYRPKIRGRFALLHHTPDKEEVDRLCAEFGEEIVQAEERLKRSKQDEYGPGIHGLGK